MKKLILLTLAALVFAIPNVSEAAQGNIPIAPFQIVQSIAQAIQSRQEPIYKSKPVKTPDSKKKRTASRSSPTPSPATTPSPTPSEEDIADQNEWAQTRERLLAQIGGTEVRTHAVFQLGSYSYQIDGGFSTTGFGGEFARLQSPKGALYVVVKFRIRNDGNETAATVADDFRLVDADGREFSPDSRAMVSVSPDFLLRQLHPGIWKKGIVVFEVPKEIIYRGVAIVIPEKGFGPGRGIVFARWTKPEHQKSRQKIASHSTIVPHENQEAKNDDSIRLATITASNQSSAAVSTTAEPSQAAGSASARKAHIKWVKFNDDEPEPKPPGKYEQTDDGAVLTLPNGNKYITKVVGDGGPLAVLFALPNQQVFSSETAKGDYGLPFVNEDESLVAMTCRPATQSGDLHIYIKEPNGKFRGENGKYRELPNEENGAVNDLLREAYDNFAGWSLEVRGITGRTLTVWAIVKGQWIEKGAGIYRFEFKLHVTPDGKIALTK